MDFELIRVFVAVRDCGGFSLAAKRLGVPRSTVSRAIASLEEQVGARLFHRTTRKVSVSTAGAALYKRVVSPVRHLEAALTELPRESQAVTGTLRVTCTADIGRAVVAEASARFCAAYPEARVEVHASNVPADLVAHGFDVALRVATRKLSDSSMVGRRMGPIHVALYASPRYVARRGMPRSPRDLAAHEMVAFQGLAWPALRRYNARARVTCDNMVFLRDALRGGAGIGAIPAIFGDPDVASGALVRVLPRLHEPVGTVYVLRQSKKNAALKVTAFCDILYEVLGQLPLFP